MLSRRGFLDTVCGEHRSHMEAPDYIIGHQYRKWGSRRQWNGESGFVVSEVGVCLLALLLLFFVFVICVVLNRSESTYLQVEATRESGATKVLQVVEVDQFANDKDVGLSVSYGMHICRGDGKGWDRYSSRVARLDGSIESKAKPLTYGWVDMGQSRSNEDRRAHVMHRGICSADVCDSERSVQAGYGGQAGFQWFVEHISSGTLGDDIKYRNSLWHFNFSDDYLRAMSQQQRRTGGFRGLAGVARLEVNQDPLQDAKYDSSDGENSGPPENLPLYVYLGITACALGLIAFAGCQEGRTGARGWRLVSTCGFCLLLGEYALLLSGY